MSQDSAFNLPGLGVTIPGKDEDGNLINKTFAGTIRRFDNLNMAGTAGIKPWLSKCPVWAVLLRNESGGVLVKRRLALCKAGAGYNVIENVSGYTTALYDAPCVAIDPWLTTTVADDDFFWGIFKGPTILTLPSSGGDILASGTAGRTPLVASADDYGRPTPIATLSSAGADAAYAIFGTTLGAFTNADTDDEISVLMHAPWFPT